MNQTFKSKHQSALTTSGILTSNRIPKDYFITKGKGESDITVHAGSYHLALKDAGIEMYNIMTYSSILPKIANRVERPAKTTHGAVMESIMAVANAPRGKLATAGIIYGWLHNKITGEKYGGLVCEYNGNLPEKEAGEQLKESLSELYTNGYSDDYELKDMMLISESMVPKKKFGTVIVSLCFTTYLFPIVERH